MPCIFSSFFYYVYSMLPVILRLVALVEDSGVGLPSPGALENLAGVSRTLSSLAVTGESDPAAIPSNSSSSLWGIDCSAGAGSTSIGWDLSQMLSMANGNSASIGGYQDSLMLVTSWIPSCSSRDCFLLSSGGVRYLDTASCSSSVPRWRQVNPGGTLSTSVGCRASGSWSCPVMPAHDGVVKLRSLVSCTPSKRYISHRSSMAVSGGFCRSDVGPGSIQKCSLLGRLKYRRAWVQDVEAAIEAHIIRKCSPKLGLRMALIHIISGLAGQHHPPYSTSPDSIITRSVQNCRSMQRYTHAFWALVWMHFSLYMASPGSSGMGNWTLLPTTNSLWRKAGISGTGERLSSRNLVAQSIRANTSMAALSAPAPKNLREWTSGWCSAGSI